MASSHGQFVWYDLSTTDIPAAKDFYNKIVGWGAVSHGDRAFGGLMLLSEQAKSMGAPPNWIGYVSVADLDATVAKAVEMGGKVYVPSTPIEEFAHFAVLADPQGLLLPCTRPPSQSRSPHRAPGTFPGTNSRPATTKRRERSTRPCSAGRPSPT
jgi:predicted enzyme related to lactoylglutathione lyase